MPKTDRSADNAVVPHQAPGQKIRLLMALGFILMAISFIVYCFFGQPLL